MQEILVVCLLMSYCEFFFCAPYIFDSIHTQYQVLINPEPKARKTNRMLLSELVKIHGATSLAHKTPAYDGSKSLYTAGELPFKSMEFVVKLGKAGREV
jgi:eukaryotic translation initiation factor 2C